MFELGQECGLGNWGRQLLEEFGVGEARAFAIFILPCRVCVGLKRWLSE